MRILRVLGLLALFSALVLTACGTEEVEVTRIVKETVVEKETVVVESTSEVVKQEVTRVVEKIITTTPDTAEPIRGGELRYAVFGAVDSLMPQHYHAGNSRDIFEFLFDSLLVWSPEGKLGPRLADEWTVSADATTFTFHIRDDAYWTDGEPITAEDVAWSIELMTHPDYYGIDYSLVAPIKGASERKEGGPEAAELGVKIIDDKTLEITTEQPYQGLLFGLGIELRPLPKHVLGDVPVGELIESDFRWNPSPSSGPFMLEEFVADDHATLVANKDYYLGEPYLDRLLIVFMADEARPAALQAQEIDVADGVPVVDAEELAKLPYLELQTWPAAHIQYVSFNWTDPKFTKEVRQAFCYAIDKGSITEHVLSGFAEPAAGILNQFYPGYTPQNDYTYDPEKARELLEEAGWDLNTEVTLIHPNYEPYTRFVAAMQANWQQVGLKVSLQAMDVAQMVGIVRNEPEKYDMATWGFKNYMDPDIYFTRRYYTGQAANLSLYSRPEIDEMIIEARHEPDPEERQALYDELQRIITEDCTNCPLWVNLEPAIVNTRVHNVQWRSFGTRDDSYKWWVEPLD